MAIQFLNTVAVDTNVLYVDTSSDRVGIGTTSPSAKLNVSGGGVRVDNNAILLALNSTSSFPQVVVQAEQQGSVSPPMGQLRWDRNPGALGMQLNYYNGTTENSLRLDGSNFRVINNGSERMRINSSGKVGIGDSDPGAKLVIAQPQIVSGGFSTPFIELKSTAQTNNTGLVAMSFSTSTADNYGYSIGALRGSSGGASSFVISHHDNSLTGSERMRIDSSGNVGIGTTSPAGKLAIKDGNVYIDRDTTSGNYAFGFYRSGAERGRLGFDYSSSTLNLQADGQMTFLTLGENERMRIDSSGNVGIGTTSPSSYLEVETSGSSGSDDIAIFSRSTGEVLKISREAGNAVLNASLNLTLSADYDNNNTGSGSNVIFKTDATERMRINSSGNVGINYTNPQQKLEVSGASRFSRTGSESIQYMEFLSTSGGNILKAVGQSKSLIFDNTSSTTNHLLFRQGGSTKMMLNLGTLLIGKTSFGVNTSGIELNPIGLVQATRTNNLPLLVNRLTSDGALVSFRRNNSQKGSISISGSTTSYNTTSDYRLKQNVVDMTGALNRVEQLQPKRFNFISEKSTVDGFIAHEVQSVIPEAVFGEKDAVDDEGNPEFQGIDQSKLVPLLTAALQEAIAKIENLETRIQTLENN